ncbi:type II toxin-antitoxin system RelE family toxin [Candidatus Stoquefichus sp. SB1]|jgi:mRNA interferase RelE/StbE|uniref:type II toxin-antitoxin system RelE family toxin n=1 Tax=Candidatus Stoquefichus sp. SB1 TaxID=1658109 RepID=UPI00067E9748|nr:type II toxin-antitoxin system RelE/ParE family toxin [Candidatus Stoquefichus sp. SB1]
MKIYEVELSKDSRKELKKIDKYQQKVINQWICRYLRDCQNPRSYGKALSGSLQKYWVYRIGHYRVICEIDDKHQIIQIITIGHRSDIYVKMVREEENLYEIEVEY